MMASENADANAGNDEETGPSAESNEHDYAHTADTNLASSSTNPPGEPVQSVLVQPSESLQMELPEPTVGAEVDCPVGNEVEAQTGVHPQKTEDSQLAAQAVHRGGPRRVRRPEDKNCSCCRLEFERHGRSFNRRAVYTFTSPETVQWAFPGCVVHEKSFLCETCAQVIRSKCKRKQSGKRNLWLKPPPTKPVCVCVTDGLKVQLLYCVYISTCRAAGISPLVTGIACNYPPPPPVGSISQ